MTDAMTKKLEILSGAAKYDVACTSSGVSRSAQKGSLGSTSKGGICHSFAADGRCISLMKILLTNHCEYDCQYCVNRRSSDVPRAAFTPREVAELTIEFYRRNYIEGLFLSSAIVKNPNHTMELLYEAVRLLRQEYHFNGYIHVKAIPGADPELMRLMGYVADRMSVNIELPSEASLKLLAPDKSKHDILAPMQFLKNNIVKADSEMVLYKHAQPFVPAGQATQMIVGASPDSDYKIVHLAESLYKKYTLKRVFYSAYMPVLTKNPILAPTTEAPMLREHRLYQADFLLRFYKFKASEILQDENENLNLNLDPKAFYALNHLEMFPVEVNKADYYTLLRVPGIGQKSAERIVAARRVGHLNFMNLKKMNIVLKRAKYFITCDGKMMEKVPMVPEILEMRLSENQVNRVYNQVSLFDKGSPLLGEEEETPWLTVNR